MASRRMSQKQSANSEGSLDQYLRDISRIPLISRTEEAELARRIRENDQEALNQLVRSNLRFVVSFAKRYQNNGVSLQDLINEGNLGLIRAAAKFDETRGIKFISYAVWWVKQAILQALAEQGRIVRVPLSRAGTAHRIGRQANFLLQEFGREATNAEIAQGLDISEEEVTRTLSIAQGHVSIDAPLATVEDSRLLDYLPDTESATPDQSTFTADLARSIDAALGDILPREAVILRMYYGLDGSDPLTLEEIGVKMSITRERARQLKERGLARLRKLPHTRALESFIR